MDKKELAHQNEITRQVKREEEGVVDAVCYFIASVWLWWISNLIYRPKKPSMMLRRA